MWTGASGRAAVDLGDLLARRRPQGVRRDAEARIVQRREGAARRVEEPEIVVRGRCETTLALGRRDGAEAAMGVEHGQQGQPHSRSRRGGGYPLGHLGGVGVGGAVGRVVQVVELGERREPALQHLHHRLRGDRFHVLGAEAREEAVHHLPPRPEAVGARTAALGEARHGALEQVGVQVGQAGDRRTGARLAEIGRRAGHDARDRAALDLQPDVARPASGQQGLLEVGVASPSRPPPSTRAVRTLGAGRRRGSAVMSIHNTARAACMPSYDTLWRNLRLATMAEGAEAVARGAVAAKDGRIAYAGPESGLPARDAARVVDCGGRWATPGLVDCHTHLVFGGDRAQEFAMRLAGASYEEIARAGGGILSTVRATRAADEDVARRLRPAPPGPSDRRGRHDGGGEVGLRARPGDGGAVPARRPPPRPRAARRGADHLSRRARPAARGRGRQGRLHRPRVRRDAAGARRRGARGCRGRLLRGHRLHARSRRAACSPPPARTACR